MNNSREKSLPSTVGASEPSPTAAHTDHPLRHFDRTCPACLAEEAAADAHGDDVYKAISEYVQSYDFRGDDGDHTPTDGERVLIEDAIMGLLAEPRFVDAFKAMYLARSTEEGSSETVFGTVVDLRLLAGNTKDDADRELLQHAADLIEVLSKRAPSSIGGKTLDEYDTPVCDKWKISTGFGPLETGVYLEIHRARELERMLGAMTAARDYEKAAHQRTRDYYEARLAQSANGSTSEDARDAARYRFLRNPRRLHIITVEQWGNIRSTLHSEALDKAVDEAMNAPTSTRATQE